jgi:hypothetical protein
MKIQNGNETKTTALSIIKRRKGHAKHGLYLTIDLSGIDSRTKTGRMIKGLKKELRLFVGDTSTASELLIHRIVYKTIKLSLYETTSLMNPQNSEAGHYLPMANSLRLDLQALAGMAGQKKAPDLQGYLDAIYNEKGDKK